MHEKLSSGGMKLKKKKIILIWNKPSNKLSNKIRPEWWEAIKTDRTVALGIGTCGKDVYAVSLSHSVRKSILVMFI